MSPISDDYNPVAQSLNTMQSWLDSNKHYIEYFATSFIILPILTILLATLTVVYYNDFAPNNRMGHIKTALKDAKRADKLKWDLQNQCLLSVFITLYVLALSSAAVQIYVDTDDHLNTDIQNLTSIYPSVVKRLQQRLINSLHLVTFIVDFCISTVMSATLFHMFGHYFGLNRLGNCCFSIITILASLSLALGLLFITGSYQILLNRTLLKNVGIATFTISILLIMSLFLILIFLAFINQLVVAFMNQLAVVSYTVNSPSSDITVWWYCAYSYLFPLCSLANHLNYIVIACIHNLTHGSGVAMIYGIVILFFYAILREFSYLFGNKLREKNCSHPLLLMAVGKIILIAFLSVYVQFNVLLLYFLPIDNEIEKAATHLISIYQTVFLFLTAMVTYLFIVRPNRSPIEIFTEAELKHNILHIKDKIEKVSDNNERDLLMAKQILCILNDLPRKDQN